MISYLATPAILLPDTSDDEWEIECDLMIKRAVVTAAFVNNEISWQEFLEGLNAYGIPDPRILEENWSQGLIYL